MLERLTSLTSLWAENRLSSGPASKGWLSRVTSRQRARSDISTVLGRQPILVHFTPDSILEDPRDFQAWNCNGRSRYGTCSGVAWFHTNYLATTNLLGNAIHTYRFDPIRAELQPLQTLHKAPSIVKPENIAFSPKGRIAALSDMGAGDIKLFHVDPESHLIAEAPFAFIDEGDRSAHGVVFSHCGRFLAFTTIDKPGVIRVYRVDGEDAGKPIRIAPFQVFENTLHPLVPKGIDFSIHDDFVVVCYAPNTTQKRFRDRRGLLTTYAFSAANGIHPKPLSVSRWRNDVRFPEDVKLLDQDRYALLTHQGDDSALVVEIEPKTGAIQSSIETLRNPESQLSFPHGVGISPDGRYAAITSYGDDKFGIYTVGCPD